MQYQLKICIMRYVQTKQWLQFLATYGISQDHLEIFFVKVRRMNGCNDNPTQQQSTAAYRKLLLHSEMRISNEANIHMLDPMDSSLHSSHILSVSSRRNDANHSNEDNSSYNDQFAAIEFT